MSLSNGVLGLLGLGVGAASTAASARAAYEQQQAANAAAEWNASLSEENAGIKDIMAEQTREMGRHQVALAKEEGQQKIATQRATYAASGVKVDTGSALDVVAEQAGKNQYQQDMIEYTTGMDAWGHEVDAYNLRQSAAMTRATKQSAGLAGITSLLGGGTSLYNQYRQYQIDFGKWG
ncbi:MAG: hypothetical protein LUE17_00825 [Planctomycetaceae bacterium]|nr:hypothetical protein [Planctomycetaceae bacterium]